MLQAVNQLRSLVESGRVKMIHTDWTSFSHLVIHVEVEPVKTETWYRRAFKADGCAPGHVSAQDPKSEVFRENRWNDEFIRWVGSVEEFKV